MLFMGSNPRLHYLQAPTLAAADKELEEYEDRFVQTHDANDVMYAFAASEDYDPAARSREDQGPPDRREHGRRPDQPARPGHPGEGDQAGEARQAVVIPESPETVGHGSHTKASLWKQYLAELLKESAR